MFGPFGPFGARFDLPEFFVGLAAGLFLAFLIARMRPMVGQAVRTGRKETKKVSDSFAAGAKDRYHEELIAFAETRHAASAIFALREILVTPRVLAPISRIDPQQNEAAAQDSLSVIPNLPDWHYLSAVYQTPSIPLEAAASTGCDLLLCGHLGSGKTTGLAYLATTWAERRIARGGKEAALPVLIHAADLVLERDYQEDPIRPLVAAAQRNASAGLSSRLPGYLKPYLRQGHILLLVDGLDELAIPWVQKVTLWLHAVRKQAPGIQIVAAGPERGYDGLVNAGLAPVAMAPWVEYEQRQFLDKWGSAWQEFVTPSLSRNQLGEVDPVLIAGWLQGTTTGWNPLEITLRAWSAFAGDVEGAGLLSGYEAYALRMMSQEERQAAEAAALTWITERQGTVPEKSLRRGTPINDLIDAGIFTRRPGNAVSFSLPAVGAYLAANAMAAGDTAVGPGPDSWEPVYTATTFLAGLSDLTESANHLLSQAGDDLEESVLTAGHWLRYANAKAGWRSPTLRSLGKIIQGASRPYGLRLRATHAMASAREETASVFFTRLISSEHASSRILGAIGLGGMRDLESVDKLASTVNGDPDLRVRQAACLALAAVGTDQALEALGHALLEGDEPVRVAAAEALANNPDEGYAMLKDAASVDNLLTRRAAVFGLARVPEDWAEQMLETTQVEDSQWVVRGAAAEALEKRRQPSWRIQPPPSDLSGLEWLVAFAAREGLGVAPGKAAMEMLRRALNSGSHDEKAAALETIGWAGANELRMEIDQALHGSDPHLQDIAFEALWRLEAAGPERQPESA